MPSRSETSIRIRTPAQWSALTSPIRVEIVEYLKLAGRSSVGRIAAALGRAPDSLYFHLRKLVAAGVIVALPSAPAAPGDAPRTTRTGRATIQRRRRARGSPASFRLAADRIQLDYDARSRRNVPRLERLASAVFRMADRGFRRAMDANLIRFEGPAPNAYFRRQVSWLPDADVARVLRHYTAIERILIAGQKRSSGRLFLGTSLFIPVAPRGR